MELFTGTGAEPRPRLRVDPAQTSFLEGRQFRVYYDFNIGIGNSLWARFICPGDVVILQRNLTVVQGNLRFALFNAGTQSGTWTAKTIFAVNGMSTRPSPVYTPGVVASSGGSLTGGTEIDAELLETSGIQAISVSSSGSETGLPAATYWVQLMNTGMSALRGTYKVVWEEVQPRSERLF